MQQLLKLTFLSAAIFWSAQAASQTLKAVDNSQNAGKVEWLDRQISTGNVPFGQAVSREFRVKNVSNENLILLQVKSSCHCTITEWQREPIAPGKIGTIKVTYDGQKEGDFYRIVTVFTNFDSMQGVPLALVGKVDPMPEAKN
jgi:hypothetical protein